MKKFNQIVILLFTIFCIAIISCDYGKCPKIITDRSILAKDSIIDNVFIPACSKVEVKDVLTSGTSGVSLGQKRELIKLIYPSKAIEVQGYLIRKRRHTNDHFTIDENGNLLFFVPQDDVVIDGIPCKRQKNVQLYRNGKLMSCYLSESTEVNGVKFKRGRHLLFDENGNAQKFGFQVFNELRERNNYPKGY